MHRFTFTEHVMLVYSVNRGITDVWTACCVIWVMQWSVWSCIQWSHTICCRLVSGCGLQ